jgi:hypothetical protein
MTEQVYALITKLLRTTQRERYQRYSNEFKEAVADLRRQRGARQRDYWSNHYIDDGNITHQRKSPLYSTHTKANLLSVRELNKGGGSFQGNVQKLVIFNNKGSVAVEGTNSGGHAASRRP